MDNRTLLAVILSLGVAYGWTAWQHPEAFQPPPPEAPVAAEIPAAAPAAPSTDSVVAHRVPISDCGLSASVFSQGGALEDLQVTDVSGGYAIDAVWNYATRFSNEAWRPYGPDPGPMRYLSASGRALAVGVGDALVPMHVTRDGEAIRLQGQADGVTITGTLSPAKAVGGPWPGLGSACVFEATYQVSGGAAWVEFADYLSPEAGYYDSVFRPTAFVGEEYHQLDDPSGIEDGATVLEGETTWFGLTDRNFALLARPTGVPGKTTFTAQDGDRYGARFTMDPAAQAELKLTVYAGPKTGAALSSVEPGFGDAIQLGFFSLFAEPMIWLLALLEGALGSWGMAIIGLTVIVKAATWPLNTMSFKSAMAMQEIQPELDRLRTTHADNPDELNRQMLALFQSKGVNPAGGCLPMLAQMPIWIALYSALLSSAELYHSEFFYLRDLSAIDPTGVLPTACIAVMVIQQRMTPTPPNMDPGQQMMLKFMPLMLGFLYYNFPAGLMLYILVQMGLSIGQQWYIKKVHGPKPA